MSSRTHLLMAVLAAGLLLLPATQVDAKKPKYTGKTLEVRNCTSMNLRIMISNLGPDIEKSFAAGARVSVPILPTDTPLIQIKSRPLKKWKTFYSLLLPPHAGGQSVFYYRWTGETLEVGAKC